LSRKVRVKICGITREEDLAATLDAGTDIVGFIVGVPSSPRNISARSATKLREMIPSSVACVVVTVPDTIQELVNVCELVKPDAVQLHGGRWVAGTVEEALPDIQLIRSISVKPSETAEDALKLADGYDTVHLDSYAEGKYGGTGKMQSLETAKQVKDAVYPRRLILSGGLTPENVKHVVITVKPYAVDVCSGVEASPGIKDHSKVEDFIAHSHVPVIDKTPPSPIWNMNLNHLVEAKTLV
jgi:phosphoribosylanthranilate isomerase